MKVEKWMDALKRCWEQKEYSVLEDVLADKLMYYESPFGPPLKSKAQVISQWKTDLPKQKNITFNYDIVKTWGNQGLVHWEATFTRVPTSENVGLDGVFLIKFDSEGKCIFFKQWWVVKPKE